MHDKGSAFWSWKGISRFTALLTEMGIDMVVAEHKEWNGKVEVFNANLHKELFDVQRFSDVAEMRRRIEETRARLKAKAFDAMMSGEAALLARDSGQNPVPRAVDVPVDNDIAETLDESLSQDDY